MRLSLTSVSYGYLYFSTCNQKQDSHLQSNTEQSITLGEGSTLCVFSLKGHFLKPI